MKRKNGLTLIESVVALTAAAAVSTAALSSYQSYSNEMEIESILNDMNNVVKAVDGRIAIDGFNMRKWDTAFSLESDRLFGSWNDITAVSRDLVVRNLTPVSNDCRGGWTPSLIQEREITLIPCKTFDSYNNKYEISAELRSSEKDDFIEYFDVYLDFERLEDFRDSFLIIKKHINEMSLKERHGISGEHKIDFVNKNDKQEKIESSECIGNLGDCLVRARFDRSGGESYVKIDGSSDIINDNFSFIDTSNGNNPVLCERWFKDESGSWNNDTAGDQVECGIGIYERSPVIAEVHASEGTFENVLMSRECEKKEWNKDTKEMILVGKVPCGLMEDGSLVTVVDKIIAKNATFNNLFSESGYFNEIYVKELNSKNIFSETKMIASEVFVSDTLNADFLKVRESLEVSGIATLKGQIFMKSLNSSEIIMDETSSIKMNNLGEIDEFYSDNLTIRKGISYIDSVTSENLNVLSGSVYVESLNSVGNIDISKNLSVDSIVVEAIDSDFILTTEYLPSVSGDVNVVSINSKKITAKQGNFENIDNKIKDLKRKIEVAGSRLAVGIPSPLVKEKIKNSYWYIPIDQRGSGCGYKGCVY